MTQSHFSKMIKLAIGASACLMSASACTAEEGVQSASSAVTTSVQQDLNTIMRWWNGSYNNDCQLAELDAAGKPIWRVDDDGKGGHIEVTSHYRPVNLKEFGDHVVYVEETKHGDPENIFRQRIYTLAIDEKTDTIRVKLWYFNDKKKYVGAWKEPSRLNDLKPDDMFALQDDCDLIVKKQGEKYHMPMADKACVFGKNYFSYQVLLGQDSFWFRDKINAVADDSIVSIAGEYTYHELDKID